MNRISKAFVAGFVGGIIAPFTALSAEPARRIRLASIERFPASVADSWRAVGKSLSDAMREHDDSSKPKAS